MDSIKVLSTKKLSPAQVDLAAKNLIDITEQDFISIQPILTEDKKQEVNYWMRSGITTAAFTSANAVTAWSQLYRDELPANGWKIFCLQGKTYDTALRLFAVADFFTAADAKALAVSILGHNIQEILFFCGNRRRDELPGMLKEQQVNVHEIIVYETYTNKIVVTEPIDGILFFSPSAVESFFSVNELEASAVCFAVGQTTAGALGGFTQNKIIVSETPGEDQVLSAVINYFKNNKG